MSHPDEVEALLDGIADVPAIDPVIRAEVRAASVADNYRRLAKHDPDAAASATRDQSPVNMPGVALLP